MLIYCVSLGCSKNLVDSQVMLGILSKNGYELAKDPQNADVILVNTCSFIQASKEESIQTILEMAEYKDQGVCRALVVAGCLAQRYAKELEKKFPEVDLFIGTGQYQRIAELLDSRLQTEVQDFPQRSYIDTPKFIHSDEPRVHTGKRFSAYLKLSEGCNRRCSFCIIPKLRGDVRSKPMTELVAEAKVLVSKGVRELNLVAQDLTHYGIDTKYDQSLEKLLPKLEEIDGLEWFRLHYVYPDRMSDELIDIIANSKKIVRYLDMPIQHTSDRVLRLMNRRLSKERLINLIEKIRNKIPDMVFRTSIIVGFPSETEEEFENLKKDLIDLNLDHVGVFEFSREEDTKSYEMESQIPSPTKKRRARQLREALQQQMENKKKLRLGQEHLVMIEGLHEESDMILTARMSIQAEEIDGRVFITDLEEDLSLEKIHPGTLARVVLTETIGLDYGARLISIVKSFHEESEWSPFVQIPWQKPVEKKDLVFVEDSTQNIF